MQKIPKMSKVLDLFKKVVVEEGWNFDELPNPMGGLETIVFGLKANYRKMMVEVTDEPAEERVMVRCRMHDKLPDEKLNKAFSLMNTMNLARWFTRLAVDTDDNELVYSRPMCYTGLRMTLKAASEMLFHAIEVADCDTEWLYKELEKQGDDDDDDSTGGITVSTVFRWNTPRGDN